MGSALPAFLTGNLGPMRQGYYDFSRNLLKRVYGEGQKLVDPFIGQMCHIAAVGVAGWYFDQLLMVPGFDYEDVFGTGGKHLKDAVVIYEYDKFHHELASWCNNDFWTSGPAAIPYLALHWGDLETSRVNCENLLRDVRRTLAEPDRGLEGFGQVPWGVGTRHYWPT
jgi:hypothetical protein